MLVGGRSQTCRPLFSSTSLRTNVFASAQRRGWVAGHAHTSAECFVNKTGERLDGGVHKSTSIPSTINLASNNQFSSDCVSQSLVRIIVLHQITGCLICKAVHRAPDYLRVATRVPPLPEKKTPKTLGYTSMTTPSTWRQMSAITSANIATLGTWWQ